MHSTRLVLAFLISVAMNSGCKKSKPTETEPVKPEKAETPAATQVRKPVDLSQLGEEVELEGYRIRPPRAYIASGPPPGPPRVRGIAWTGTRRADNSAPSLLFMLATIPEGERLPPLESGIQEFLGGIQKRRTDWKQSVPERIEIGGMPFMRAAWEGKETGSGRLMRGVLYLAIDGRTVIQLSSQDFEPHFPATLAIADVAIETFRKSSKKINP